MVESRIYFTISLVICVVIQVTEEGLVIRPTKAFADILKKGKKEYPMEEPEEITLNPAISLQTDPQFNPQFNQQFNPQLNQQTDQQFNQQFNQQPNQQQQPAAVDFGAMDQRSNIGADGGGFGMRPTKEDVQNRGRRDHLYNGTNRIMLGPNQQRPPMRILPQEAMPQQPPQQRMPFLGGGDRRPYAGAGIPRAPQQGNPAAAAGAMAGRQNMGYMQGPPYGYPQNAGRIRVPYQRPFLPRNGQFRQHQGGMMGTLSTMAPMFLREEEDKNTTEATKNSDSHNNVTSTTEETYVTETYDGPSTRSTIPIYADGQSPQPGYTDKALEQKCLEAQCKQVAWGAVTEVI